MTTQEPVPLKECPFCGETDIREDVSGVWCYNGGCRAGAPSREIWNARQQPAEAVQPAAAQGWRLVPVEPTPEMARELLVYEAGSELDPSDLRLAGEVWQRTLAAAPPAPTTKETPP